ncbi:MAG: exosome complex RNA-binding protein Rrp4 [Acidilobus sp.]
MTAQETQTQKRYIVLPGEIIEGLEEYQRIYAYEHGNVTRAAVAGIVDAGQEGVNYVPLKGFYFPKVGDVVIGLVTSHGAANWFLDINSPYLGVLSVQDFFGVKQGGQVPDDLFSYLRIGDYVKVKIVAFDRTRDPLLTVQEKGLGRIVEGTVVTVKPVKVPRIIGRKGSMLEVLKSGTGCDFFVAVNGRVHITCPNEALQEIAIMAIEMIEEQSHVAGLTKRVKDFIEEERKVRGV